MDLRNRRGGITAAEGCMFGAVVLFVVLLLGMLYIAFLRFRDPPMPTPRPSTVGMISPVTPSTTGATPRNLPTGLHV